MPQTLIVPWNVKGLASQMRPPRVIQSSRQLCPPAALDLLAVQVFRLYSGFYTVRKLGLQKRTGNFVSDAQLKVYDNSVVSCQFF